MSFSFFRIVIEVLRIAVRHLFYFTDFNSSMVIMTIKVINVTVEIAANGANRSMILLLSVLMPIISAIVQITIHTADKEAAFFVFI